MQLKNSIIRQGLQTRKDVKMKILLTASFFWAIVSTTAGQQLLPLKSSYDIYRDAIRTVIILDQKYPKFLGISDKLFSHLKEYELSNHSNDSLYNLIKSNDWNFILRYNPPSEGMSHERIATKKLLQSFVDNSKFSNKSLLYTFSPVIYSNDLQSAFLISSITTNKAVHSITFLFYKKIEGKWINVNNRIPYIDN